MARTILTISDDDKEWLDRYSRLHGKSTAETIRGALREFRRSTQARHQALKGTRGLWKGRKRDGLEIQRELREEWSP